MKASATCTPSTRTKRGDITTSGQVWQFDKIRRCISTAAIADGLLYISDFSGFLHCLDAKTGQEYWVHDVFAAVWGSPIVIDGRVYLSDEDGDVVVMQHGKEMKVLHEMNMGSATYATPAPANGVLVPEQPQSAVRARGEMNAGSPAQRRSSCWRRRWSRSSRSALTESPASEWRSFRGSYQQTGVSAATLPADAEGGVAVRRRRNRGVVSGDCRRRRLRRRR